MEVCLYICDYEQVVLLLYASSFSFQATIQKAPCSDLFLNFKKQYKLKAPHTVPDQSECSMKVNYYYSYFTEYVVIHFTLYIELNFNDHNNNAMPL